MKYFDDIIISIVKHPKSFFLGFFILMFPFCFLLSNIFLDDV